MTHSREDDAVEALLQRQFEGAVADDGFCDRVMKRLPARPRRRAWPLWSGIAIGVAACASTLSSNPGLQLGWRGWIGGDMSPSALAVLAALAGMSLLAMCWSLAEADGG